MFNILKWPYLCYRPANAINAMFQSSIGLSETADLMVKLLVSKILEGSCHLSWVYAEIAMTLQPLVLCYIFDLVVAMSVDHDIVMTGQKIYM